MKPPARPVYIVDDEAGMRKALSRLLGAEGFDVRPFASAQEFLDVFQPDEVACIILDLAMPGIDGLDLQRRLLDHDPAPSVVFLTARGTIPKTVQAMKAGAVDFLAKPVTAADLLGAVQAALRHAEKTHREHEELGALSLRYQRLTPREREVMALVVAGWPNKRIAAQLGVGEPTVKVHRARVMHKMKAESLAGLVRTAEKLASPPPPEDGRRPG
jgi:FixJ family two-component response regulator